MKKKYCKVTIDGTCCIYNDLKEALSTLEYDVQGFIDMWGKPVEVTFETVMMTDEEFEALPEFDGLLNDDTPERASKLISNLIKWYNSQNS